MFSRAFSQFNVGSRSSGAAPSPIILATAGVRIASGLFPHANIISGVEFPIVAGVAGFVILPINFSLEKNITVAYAPTNASFNLRLAGLATNLATSLTPVITSTGVRFDFGIAASALNLGAGSMSALSGQALVIAPSAGNGAGSSANLLRYTVAYQLVKMN